MANMAKGEYGHNAALVFALAVMLLASVIVMMIRGGRGEARGQDAVPRYGGIETGVLTRRARRMKRVSAIDESKRTDWAHLAVFASFLDARSSAILWLYEQTSIIQPLFAGRILDPW